MMAVGPKVEVAARTEDVLGEGPLHDAADGSVRWVDIGRSLWHRLSLADGRVATIRLSSTLTGFAPMDRGYVGAFADYLGLLDQTGSTIRWLHKPEAHLPSNRFNDAGTDADGRFLAGTMSKTGASGAGALYSLAASGELSILRGGLGISNTVAFSPAGDIFYTADTATAELMAFRYDLETGRLGDRLPSFQPPSDLPGAPDGSAVDVEGCSWNARWGGGCIVRLTPAGAIDRIVKLPVSLPTSCCFVGATLYVTTSRWNFGPSDLEREPLAGSLLCIELPVDGLPRARFAGRFET